MVVVVSDPNFWFQNIGGPLTFENAFPCTPDELDIIVTRANGNVKVGVYILTDGDDEKAAPRILQNIRSAMK